MMLPALLTMAGQQQSLGALKGAHDSAIGRFDKNYYDPYTSATAGAPGMLGDSLGLGGAEGSARAREAFKVSPGFEFSLNQGLEALKRSAASRGMLSSGNTTQDILDYAIGRGNQEFGNWQAKLGDLSRLGLSAASGQTGRQGALAGIDTGFGNAQAGVYQNTANALAQMFQPQPQQQSGLGSAIAGGLNLGGAVLGGFKFKPLGMLGMKYWN